MDKGTPPGLIEQRRARWEEAWTHRTALSAAAPVADTAGEIRRLLDEEG